MLDNTVYQIKHSSTYFAILLLPFQHQNRCCKLAKRKTLTPQNKGLYITFINGLKRGSFLGNVMDPLGENVNDRMSFFCNRE